MNQQDPKLNEFLDRLHNSEANEPNMQGIYESAEALTREGSRSYQIATTLFGTTRSDKLRFAGSFLAGMLTMYLLDKLIVLGALIVIVYGAYVFVKNQSQEETIDTEQG